MVKVAEEIRFLISLVKTQQLNHQDPRSLALVITHLEDAVLRYEHANA